MRTGDKHASTLADLKTEHLAAADVRWEEAVNGALRFFHYENKSPAAQGTYYADPSHIQAVRTFARRFLEVSGMVRFYLLGGVYYGTQNAKNTYYHEVSNEDPCSFLEFIGFFIGHELLDDGMPGLAYHKRRGVFGADWEACGPDDPNAEPYFHRCVDILREKYPGAQALSVELALETLNAFDAEHRAFEESLMQEPSKRELQLRALAEELSSPVMAGSEKKFRKFDPFSMPEHYTSATRRRHTP